MDEADLRRLILNLNTSLILMPQVSRGAVPSERDINRAIQTAVQVDKQVAKRRRWEERNGSAAVPG